MRILELFRLWREYGALFKLPNLDDSAELREWCGELTGLAQTLAELTTTELDDAMAAALADVVADDDSWLNFYTILTAVIDLLDGDDDDSDLVAADDSHVLAMADKTGIDPATIIALVMAVAKFIRWFRERRKDG